MTRLPWPPRLRPQYVLNFAQSRRLPFKVALDNTGAIARDWGDIKITPTTYLVNKRGQIVKAMWARPISPNCTA